MLSASPAVTGDPTAIWNWRPYGISIRRSQRSERRSWFSPRRLERYTRALHKKLNLTFNILTDQHLKVAEQFRLVFTLPDYLRDLYKSFGTALDRFHDEPEYRLPMPARYIIDKRGHHPRRRCECRLHDSNGTVTNLERVAAKGGLSPRQARGYGLTREQPCLNLPICNHENVGEPLKALICGFLVENQ